MLYPITKVIDKGLHITKRLKKDILLMIQLVVSAILFSHMLACIWISLGLLDTDKLEEFQHSWLLRDENNFPYPDDNKSRTTVYCFAIYWILTTMTTVGYGDYTGSTNVEYLFSMALQFTGVCFSALMTATMFSVFGRSYKF